MLKSFTQTFVLELLSISLLPTTNAVNSECSNVCSATDFPCFYRPTIHCTIACIIRSITGTLQGSHQATRCVKRRSSLYCYQSSQLWRQYPVTQTYWGTPNLRLLRYSSRLPSLHTWQQSYVIKTVSTTCCNKWSFSTLSCLLWLQILTRGTF